jgi:hypothetical protein
MHAAWPQARSRSGQSTASKDKGVAEQEFQRKYPKHEWR